MKKIIALLLVLMLTMTIFVACTKEPETQDPSNDPGTEETPDSGNNGEENPEDEEINHDSVGGLENTNQHDGAGTELPIVPIQ